MKLALSFYESQPEIVRKAERDFVVAFMAALVASGVLDQATPNIHTLSHAVVAAAGLAAWRVARSYITPTPA